MMPGEFTPKKKRPSGAELRRRRVARGLPARTPATAASHRAANQRYEERHPQRWKQRTPRSGWDTTRGVARALRARVAALKVERGCTDCGYRAHPDALHFDHLPRFTKDLGIARLIDHMDPTRLEAEMAKCEVVCANCHAIRTAERRRAAKVK